MPKCPGFEMAETGVATTEAQEAAVAIKTLTLSPVGESNETGSKCLFDYSQGLPLFPMV